MIYCQKISQLKKKRHFEETLSFDTHFTEKLLPLAILQKSSFFE